MREKVQRILDHGINCFVNRQLIYNFPEELFADAGVMAIEHADFDGIERLALVTGGEIASTFEDPSNVMLGTCEVKTILIQLRLAIPFSTPTRASRHLYACTMLRTDLGVSRR